MVEIIAPEIIGIIDPVGIPCDLGEDVDEDTKEAVAAYRKNTGLAIKQRRKELGMTQEDLSEKTGIPQSHLSKLESGLHSPTNETIERIAKALNTQPSQLDLMYR